MDDAGPVGLADVGQIREPGQEALDEGPARRSRTGVHHDIDRFVDHDDVVVDVHS